MFHSDYSKTKGSSADFHFFKRFRFVALMLVAVVLLTASPLTSQKAASEPKNIKPMAFAFQNASQIIVQPGSAIGVTAPDLLSPNGASVTIPLAAQDTTGQQIISYQYDLVYDENVIVPNSVPCEVSGTLSSMLSAVCNPSVPGLLKVAVYGSTPISGAGVLMNLKFDVVGITGEVSPLNLQQFMFNEGTPQSATQNGQVEVSDSLGPMITYTPLANTTSTGSRLLSITVSDNVLVDTVTFLYSVNEVSQPSINCTAGIQPNYDCLIPGQSEGSAVSYYVAATDTSSNTTENPAASAPNLYTIGSAAIPGGTYTNISLPNGASLSGNVIVTGVLVLDGTVSTDMFILRLGCDATISGAGGTNYVVGTLNKDFCSTGSFMYPVGTTPGNPFRHSSNPSGVPSAEYAPMMATITAGSFPSSLAVNVTDAFLPNSDTTQSASRYWDVTETGEITADISFTYLDEDVNGTESNYKVLRRETGIVEVYPGGTVDAVTNVATATNVTNFSQWAAGNLAPTAANVNIIGRVLTASGRGIFGARVIMVDSDGSSRIVLSNPFGYYRFSNVPVAETYVFSVFHKRFQFVQPTIAINIHKNYSGLNFTALNRKNHINSNQADIDSAMFDFDYISLANAQTLEDFNLSISNTNFFGY